MGNVIRDAVTYTEHAERKTITAMDIAYILKQQGRTLYGFGGKVVSIESKNGYFISHTDIKNMFQQILEPVLVKLYILDLIYPPYRHILLNHV